MAATLGRLRSGLFATRLNDYCNQALAHAHPFGNVGTIKLLAAVSIVSLATSRQLLKPTP